MSPDFKKWAELIGYDNTRLEHALRSAFEQGYQLGFNKGWAIELDKELKNEINMGK